MIAFDVGNRWFQYRVGGVCVEGGDVLLHRAATDDFWALPGGRCEAGEAAVDALRREMWEETGADVAVGPLLCVVENFYTHSDKPHHELGVYFACTLSPGHPYRDRTREHAGVEDTHPDGVALPLVFRWFPVASLADVPLYPACLRDALAEANAGTRYLVQADNAANRTESRPLIVPTEGTPR